MAQVHFIGGAGRVTGAMFLFEDKGLNILLDCGMIQGSKDVFIKNYENFPFDVSKIDYVIVSHAHIDHLGRIPFLVRKGFKGKIISTEATKELAPIMLEDTQKVSSIQAKQFGLNELFSKEDIKKALDLWIGKPYNEPFKLGHLVINFKDAGHILGSAITEIIKNDKKFVYTGDLGNTPAPLLKDTEKITDANYMIIESVYGDRNHEEKHLREKKLLSAIKQIKKTKGILLIPAFSLQRSQIIIYEINKFVEDGLIEPIPVYLDSPLALKVLDVFRKYSYLFNERVQQRIRQGDDIFSFPLFVEVSSGEESLALLHKNNGPKIIISASGMSVGGRVLLHEQKILQDKRNIILFVGYQSVYSLGRQIQDGAKVVTINNKKVKVSAKKLTIRGFSAHKDMDNLIDFVSHTAKNLQRCFVALGEPKSSLFLVQRLREYLEVDAIAPDEGEIYELDF